MSAMVGCLYTEYHVTCGQCGRDEALGATSRDAARVEARAQGWRHIQPYGWLCLTCTTPSRRYVVTRDVQEVF